MAKWWGGKKRSPESIRSLLAALRDDDPSTRRQAVYALGAIEKWPAEVVEDAIKALTDAFAGNDAEARRVIINVLGSMDNVLAMSSLLAVSRETDAATRDHALVRLAFSASVFVEACSKASRESAKAAIKTLTDLGVVEALRIAAQQPETSGTLRIYVKVLESAGVRFDVQAQNADVPLHNTERATAARGATDNQSPRSSSEHVKCRCPGCKKLLRIPTEYVGKTVKCPGCQGEFRFAQPT